MLANKQEVDDYLQRSKAQAELVRNENERRFDPVGIRDRVLARRRGA